MSRAHWRGGWAAAYVLGMKLWPLFALLAACSSTTFITNVVAMDGGDAAVVVVDAGSEAATDAGADAADANHCAPTVPAPQGSSTTCDPVGTGKPSACDPLCVPKYAYTTTTGTPNVANCVQVVGTDTFCCPYRQCTRDDSALAGCNNIDGGGFPYAWVCPSLPGNDSTAAVHPPGSCAFTTFGPPDSGTTYSCCATP